MKPKPIEKILCCDACDKENPKFKCTITDMDDIVMDTGHYCKSCARGIAKAAALFIPSAPKANTRTPEP